MASIRDLKNDINNVLGAIIEGVYIWETGAQKHSAKEGDAIIDEAIAVFDDLIAKVNNKSVTNRKAHLKTIRKELEAKSRELVDKLNALN